MSFPSRPHATLTLLCSALLMILSWCIAPAALALVQLQLTDLAYHECPPELAQGAITSGGTAMEANCFIITGTAVNGTNKTITNADIYGRIFDANDEPVMQNRGRLGSIETVPPGKSPFELRVSIPANQPTPLKLLQFKAAGFTGTVRR